MIIVAAVAEVVDEACSVVAIVTGTDKNDTIAGLLHAQHSAHLCHDEGRAADDDELFVFGFVLDNCRRSPMRRG